MSFCPACGNPVSDAADVRFCARCGKELTPAAAGADGVSPDPSATPTPPAAGPSAPPPAAGPSAQPGVPPVPPPAAQPAVPPVPPGAAPPTMPAVPPAPAAAVPAGYAAPVPPAAPPGPSPAARFARRVFTGRWDGAALAALAPAVLLLGLAALLGGTSGGLLSGSGIGFLKRSRIALALLLQGVGGSVDVHAPKDEPTVDDDFGSDDSSGDSSGDSDGSDGFDDSSGGTDGFDDGSGDGSDPFGDSSGDDSDPFGDSSGDDSDPFGDGSGDGSDPFGDSSGDDSDPFGDGSGDGSDPFGDGSDGSDGSGDTSADTGFDHASYLADGDDGSDTGSFSYSPMTSGGHTVHTAISMIPLTVTALWVLALALALRAVRRRASGPESAVRVALLSGAATLVLALLAQPSIEQVHLHDAPVFAVLGSIALAFVTAFAMLPAPGRAAWLAARPGLVAALRVLRATGYALLATVGVAAVVVLCVALGHYDDVTGWGVVLLAFLLPNAGVSGLSLGWGGPFDAHFRFSSTGAGDGVGNVGNVGNNADLDLGDLSHMWDGWAAVGAVAGGVVCALLIGVLAARLTRGRAEQFAVAGLFTVLFVALAGLSGVTFDDGVVLSTAGTHESFGPNVGYALLVALLWSFGGVLVAPYAARALGARGAALYGPAVTGAPAGGPQPAYGTPPYGQQPYGPQGAQPYGPPPGPYGPQPQTPPGAVPPQGSAPSAWAGQAPDAASAPPAPPGPPAGETTVHDLGVVQPPRLDKRDGPPDHR